MRAKPAAARRPRAPGRGPRLRAAVLAATLDELTTSGFSGLTMDNVARRAGVHKTSLYRNWKDRASLVADALAENVATGVPIPDTGSVETDLRQYAQALIGWLTSPLGRAVLGATISDAARAEPEIAEIERRFYVDRLQRARAMIARAVTRGELPGDIDPDAVIKTVLAPIYLRVLITAEPVDEATAEQAARVALVAARAGVLSSS